MAEHKKIQSALISVYHKDNLEQIIRLLHAAGVKLYATGGTQDFIEKLKIPVISVESITDYPSIFGGRVKTLHPKIFGGILHRRGEAEDISEAKKYNIPAIDLVVVDLYPFEETVKHLNPNSLSSGEGWGEAIEMIDIGGISLIRAAAKNFSEVLIIPSREQYGFLLDVLQNHNGSTTEEQRKLMAAHAFNITSHYDTTIFNFFNRDNSVTAFKKSILTSRKLRYGENPHQQGVFFGEFEKMFEQLQGKEISYNNLLDVDAAVSLIAEFNSAPALPFGEGEVTFAILKHNNACGIASRKNILDAWKDALAADPVSAFGGILVANRKIEKDVAAEISNLFFEVLIAPEYSADALEILKQKKNRIILVQKSAEMPLKQFRSLLNGVVEQDRDTHTEAIADMKTVTKLSPTPQQFSDLEFANKVVKHTRSNTIVLAKNKQLLASGTGQTSRVDALEQAIAKAKKFGFDLKGAVMASDAFFPFPDCVEIAGKAGINAVIQPGGSVKDNESIDYCNKHGIAMVLTGIRHFRH